MGGRPAPKRPGIQALLRNRRSSAGIHSNERQKSVLRRLMPIAPALKSRST